MLEWRPSCIPMAGSTRLEMYACLLASWSSSWSDQPPDVYIASWWAQVWSFYTMELRDSTECCIVLHTNCSGQCITPTTEHLPGREIANHFKSDNWRQETWPRRGLIDTGNQCELSLSEVRQLTTQQVTPAFLLHLIISDYLFASRAVSRLSCN